MAAVILVHGPFVLASGVSHANDSIAYARGADRLIATGFDFAAVIGQADTLYPAALYLLFATLVALLKLLLGAHWGTGLVSLTLLAEAGVAAMLVGVVRRSTDSAPAAWGALGLFLAAFGIVRWTPFLVSDPTFMLLAFVIFALTADRILERKGSWLPVFAATIAAVLYRPTGVALVPAVTCAMFIARTDPGRWRKAAAALAMAGAVAGAWVFAWLMQQPSRWPFPAMSRTIEVTADHYAVGEVVSARPETYHMPPVTLLDHGALVGDRFLHFFAVTAADFSLAHKLVEAAFFLPVYGLAAGFATALLRGRNGLSGRQKDVFLAAAAFVLVTALFHGMLQVDFDWRYRLPVLPHMILLAAGGIALLSRRRMVG